MPIVETKINRFDGGITNDSRDSRKNIARVISNFDILTDPKRMIPYRSSESGEDTAARTIRNFGIAIRTGTTYSLYGHGRTSAASDLTEIYYKDLTTGASNDLDDAVWTETVNNVSAAGAPNYNCFVYYQRTGYFYGARAGTAIWRYDPDGGDAWADTTQALTYTQIGQGIVHSKDDILYIPYYNAGGFIARNNNATWNTTALTLPIHYIPTSICEYGNFLAIACVPTSGMGNSRVYLWDRDASLTTLSESIDWGDGMLIILEEIDGELVGISQVGGGATSFSGIPASTISHRDRVIFRKLAGNHAVKILELQADHAGGANTTLFPLYKQKINNRLYFQLLIELNGAIRDGVWSLGRSFSGEPFALVHERSSNNNTALATSDSLRGFFFVGDYLFQAFTTGGTHTINKTNDRNDSAPYAHNSVYESKRFDGSEHGYDSSYYKDLKEVTVDTEYMPTAGELTLAYRTDATASWTTIFTNSTDSSISRTGNNIASSGVVLPTDYKEIEFRITVTAGETSGRASGVVITGLHFKEDIKTRRFNTA